MDKGGGVGDDPSPAASSPPTPALRDGCLRSAPLWGSPDGGPAQCSGNDQQFQGWTGDLQGQPHQGTAAAWPSGATRGVQRRSGPCAQAGKQHGPLPTGRRLTPWEGSAPKESHSQRSPSLPRVTGRRPPPTTAPVTPQPPSCWLVLLLPPGAGTLCDTGCAWGLPCRGSCCHHQGHHLIRDSHRQLP